MTNADVVAYIGQWRLSSVAARAPAFARDTVAKTAMGLTPLTSFTATLLVVRNQHTLRAWNTRQEENRRRAAAGLPPYPQTPQQTLAGLAAGAP